MNDSLYLYGLSHKTAPVEVRERLAFSDELCRAALPELNAAAGVNEALIISTCNRLELIVESSLDERRTKEIVVDFLCRTHKIRASEFAGYCYQISGAAAVKHLFRVASSLDSMIVGEEQIVGQVRKAYALAAEARAAGTFLHKLLHHAFRVAKRVRSETRIAKNSVSAASAAVELGKNVFGSLRNKSALVVGAGEMAERAVKNLVQAGANRITVANRTPTAARKLADDFGIEVVDFRLLGENLCQADITVCTTSAEHFVITNEMIEKAVACRNQPTVLVDITLPRNVEQPVHPIENLYLYDLDDLTPCLQEKCREQDRAIAHAEHIISEEVKLFQRTLKATEAGKRLGLIRDKMQQTAKQEFSKQRYGLGDLSPEQEQAVERLLISAVNKIADPILYGLRKSQKQHESSEFIDILSHIIGEGEMKMEN